MEKGAEAFRTISEVAEELDLPQHVLRFWEMRFSQIRPMKRSGGRRFYRPEDVDLLRGIKRLLYGEGYTIKGVQRILKEQSARFVMSIGRGEAAPSPAGRKEWARPDAPSEEQGETEPPQEQASLDWAPAPPPPPPQPRSFAALPGAGAAQLNNSQTRILRAALSELLECSRLLGAARTN